MEYVFLGSTGVRVSKLCMGTMTFGREADRTASAQMFRRCREAGINFFDCANTYAEGEAETILGELVSDCREELIITTKVSGAIGPGPNDRGSSRRHIMAAVEASLRRLRTDRIDLYFLHSLDANTPIEETLRVLDDLVSQGKIVYTGASNFAAWQVTKALGVCAREAWAGFKCIQPMYSLVKRQAEVELLPLAQSERLGVITYSPLGGGLLTGKYRTVHPPKTGRLVEHKMYALRYGDTWMHEVAQRFCAFAQEHGFQPASLAVAWVARHPAVTAPIIGARNVVQLEESLAATSVDMTPELYAQLSSLSPKPPPATDRTEEGTL